MALSKLTRVTSLVPLFAAVFCFAALFANSGVFIMRVPDTSLTALASCTCPPALGFQFSEDANASSGVVGKAPWRFGSLDQLHSTWNLTILIHTSEAMWSSRAQAIRDTWLSIPLPTGIRMFWVLDKNITSEPSLQINHSTRPGLKPWHNEPIAMAERVLQAFNQVLLNKEVSKWYLKADDDTFVNVANVISLIETFENPMTMGYYVGAFGCRFSEAAEWCHRFLGIDHYDCDFSQSWAGSDDTEAADNAREHNCNGQIFACGGAGYLLSYKSLQSLIKYEQDVGCPRHYEDVMVGWTLMKASFNTTCVEPHGSMEFCERCNIDDVDPNKVATAHKVLPEAMRVLWRKVSPTA